MGGTMALHVAYRFQRALAGVFCLGGYLSSTSPVYEVSKFHRVTLSHSNTVWHDFTVSHNNTVTSLHGVT